MQEIVKAVSPYPLKNLSFAIFLHNFTDLFPLHIDMIGPKPDLVIPLIIIIDWEYTDMMLLEYASNKQHTWETKFILLLVPGRSKYKVWQETSSSTRSAGDLITQSMCTRWSQWAPGG